VKFPYIREAIPEKENAMRNKWWAKLLRTVGIVLMGLTAAFTLLGGAGTTCIALNPAGFGGRFSGIAPFQWLYILFVLVTVAIGVMGVRAVVLLSQGRRNAYRYALIALIAGTVVGAIHIFASRALRGGSLPVDMVVYTTVLTLLVFLLFRIPVIWQGVDFGKPESAGNSRGNAAAIAMAASGLLTLGIQFIMAPTHTISGINYADVWHIALSLSGGALILIGAGIVLHDKMARIPERKTASTLSRVSSS
jgi:hypothetical protein